jgi:hypothetical protein
MASIFARLLVIATGFSACLATWPVRLDAPPGTPIPELHGTTNPPTEGIVVDDANEREEEEREEDPAPLLLLAGGSLVLPGRHEPGVPCGRDFRHAEACPRAALTIRGPPLQG